MDKSVDFFGDLVLMYAALHPEKVKNVITVAIPGDFGADHTLWSLWTKNMNVETLLDSFGNAPSVLINAAFQLRNPIENIHKYPHFFERIYIGVSCLPKFGCTIVPL